MKKVAIIGLGWLGMPLALALQGRGYQVAGSKTTPDGVDAARMCGVECYPLQVNPQLDADPEDLQALFQVDALVITLPASRTVDGAENYCLAVQQVVDTALAFSVPRIIFTSSVSVYGDTAGQVREGSPCRPVTPAGQSLLRLEEWLHQLPNTSVDILRLAGLVGPDRHPGRFLAGRTGLTGGAQGVNLVHLDDVTDAIMLLLKLPRGGHRYNLCAPEHPAKRDFYPEKARQMGLTPPAYLAEDQTAAGGKIVDGSRICHELGFEYRYPDPARMPFA
ncbi:SDR family oxidoreductase [Biostraticola tofi]|uniref:Nucleoside-diphosphate-sugar epimerase n=1 Tax=Biostraticola tofi TaxID=466109 RepID=A0A4V2W5K6_9GAMM|nr:SDR family oxidoreductase [Biostraticola tofi]TCW00186.1 nucleoside-diphosphate-sugar epimerase [Biostraticola tofi]